MKDRLLSLDVFRGLTVALMILVNNPGNWSHIHAPLRHARWHGWTPTDLVFPFFLFIVGVAVSLSFSRRVEAGAHRSQLLKKIITRTVVIFVMGLFLNGFPFLGGSDQWHHFRIWGVLQRIAVCYLIVGLLVVLLKDNRQRSWLGLGFILVYEMGMRLPLVDGWGGGSFTPTTNFVRYLDLKLWGANHLWSGAGLPFDPEGLWSTLPAAVTTLLGFFTGEFLRKEGAISWKLRLLVLSGFTASVLGQALHFIEPINKQLWTTSYVILTTGLAWLVLAISIWIIDVKKWQTGSRPAVVFGSNALVVFVGSGMLARLLVLIRVPTGATQTTTLKSWLYENLFASWAGPIHGSLLFAMAFVAFWLGILWILYRKEIFIRV